MKLTGGRLFRSIALASWIAATVPAWGAVAQGQDEQAEDPAESRAAAFRAVSGPTAESVPGGALLIGAYAVAWTLVLLFVVRLAYLRARTASELAELEKRLTSGPGARQPE